MATIANLNVNMTASIGRFLGKMRLAQTEMGFTTRNAGRLRDQVRKTGVGFGTLTSAVHVGLGALRVFAVAAGAASAALAGLVAVSVKVAADFETGLVRVGAIAKATDEQLAALGHQARAMSRNVGKSARDLADGMGFLAMAGFRVNEIMTAMPAVTRLSAIGMMDFGKAADLATNIMTGMGIAVEDVDHAVDVMVNTITSANTDMRQLGDAMKYVAPFAKALDISIEQTAAAVGLLGNAGLQGEQAGTILRNALMRLLNPTARTQKIIKALGADFSESKLKAEGFIGIIKELQRVGAGSRAISKIFGARAAAGILELVSQGAGRLEYFAEQNEMAADSTALFEEILATFENRAENFKNTLADLAIVVGDEWKMAIGEAMSQTTEWIEQNENLKLQLRDLTQDGILWTLEAGIAFTTWLESTIPTILGVMDALVLLKDGTIVTFKAFETFALGFTSGVASILQSIAVVAPYMAAAVAPINPVLSALLLGLRAVMDDVDEFERKATADFRKSFGELTAKVDESADSLGQFSRRTKEMQAGLRSARSTMEGFKSGLPGMFAEANAERDRVRNIREQSEALQEMYSVEPNVAKFLAWADVTGQLADEAERVREAMLASKSIDLREILAGNQSALPEDLRKALYGTGAPAASGGVGDNNPVVTGKGAQKAATYADRLQAMATAWAAINPKMAIFAQLQADIARIEESNMPRHVKEIEIAAARAEAMEDLKEQWAEAAAARKALREEIESMSEADNQRELERYRKQAAQMNRWIEARKEMARLERETRAGQHARGVAAFDTQMVDPGLLQAKIAEQNFRKQLDQAEGDDKRILRAQRYNQTLMEQARAFNSVSQSVSQLGQNWFEMQREMEGMSAMERQNAQLTQTMQILQAIPSLGRDVAIALGASAKEAATAQAILNAAMALTLVIMGWLQSRPDMIIAGVAAGAKAGAALATMGQDVKSTVRGPSMRTKKHDREEQKDVTREAVEQALKNAGLFQVGWQKLTLNRYGADPVKFSNRNRTKRGLIDLQLDDSRQKI